MKPSLIGACYFSIVSIAVALVFAGTEDFPALVFWTLAGAVPAGFLGRLLLDRTGHMSRPACLLLSILSGAVFGLIWTGLVSLVLGPWIGAFGAPVLLCWIAGGSTSFAAARFHSWLPAAKAVLFGGVLALVSSLAVLALPTLARQFGGDQKLITFVFRYTPRGEALVINEDQPSSWQHEQRLNESEVGTLRERYEKGYLQLEQRGSYGEGAEARVIIVLESAPAQPIRLPQPNRTNLFYFQASTGFEIYPTQAAVLRRSITLSSREYAWQGSNYIATGIMVDSWDGSATGSDVMRWLK